MKHDKLKGSNKKALKHNNNETIEKYQHTQPHLVLTISSHVSDSQFEALATTPFRCCRWHLLISFAYNSDPFDTPLPLSSSLYRRHYLPPPNSQVTRRRGCSLLLHILLQCHLLLLPPPLLSRPESTCFLSRSLFENTPFSIL